MEGWTADLALGGWLVTYRNRSLQVDFQMSDAAYENKHLVK